jgi:hypothetical protein
MSTAAVEVVVSPGPAGVNLETSAPIANQVSLGVVSGPAGPAGPAGAAGTSGGSYQYLFNVAASTWVINHPLPYPPAVTTVDTADDVIVGDVSYPTSGQVSVTFSSPVTGWAYLS